MEATWYMPSVGELIFILLAGIVATALWDAMKSGAPHPWRSILSGTQTRKRAARSENRRDDVWTFLGERDNHNSVALSVVI